MDYRHNASTTVALPPLFSAHRPTSRRMRHIQRVKMYAADGSIIAAEKAGNEVASPSK
ncbi:hypothetical protein SAY86_007975 [Trapa natans]|uniref:Uncharacterized protein n=1 Tax=Trapa natans TaxID=22666 RepID=A0AAN7R190_TRANT|nr:hypothetical protein SAY86_007975 [Trapa natans]